MGQEQKRILVLVPGFSSKHDDWSIPVLRHLVRRLSQSCNVTVLAIRYPFESVDYEIEGVRVISVGAGTNRGAYQLKYWFRTVRYFRQEHNNQPFDLIHAFWGYEPGIFAVLLGKMHRIPVVVSMMGGELVQIDDINFGMQHSKLARWSLNRVFKSADILTAGSTPMKKLCDSYDNRNDTRMIPLGIDPTYFNEHRQETSPPWSSTGVFNLLHVGSHALVKEHDMLLTALKLVIEKRNDVILHLVGSLPDIIEHRIHQNEILRTHVIRHGTIQHHQLPKFYQHADLFVLSSRFESQGMVLIEALACGCPTVSTRVGSAVDLLPSDFTVPVQRPDMLAKQISSMISHYNIRRKQQLEAVRPKLTSYSLQTTVLHFQHLYEEKIAISN